MYDVVIGLEIHCELKSNSKNFSGATNGYCEQPNTQVSPIDLGLPGIMPFLNKEAVKKAVKVAKALNCKIPERMIFDRKNYLYPDLPKGYQITQVTDPVGTNGYVMFELDGEVKKVLIHDTHLEEDTANMEHMSAYSLINYNRCGVPLLETVTEPCISSSKEAIAFLETYRTILLYLGVSDARADQGQIRCDVNISLKPKGSTALGTRTEMKNINSFANVKLAIESEIRRQEEILNNGGKIEQETRRYDEVNDCTYLMRSKEDAIDYKYFIEPNIPPVPLTKEFLEEVEKEIPMLRYDRLVKYKEEYNLTEVEANTLTREKEISDYFEECIKLGINPKIVTNWITGPIISYLNKEEISINDIYLTPALLNELINLQNDGKISSKQAREVLEKVLEEKKNPTVVVDELGIKQIGDDNTIREIVTRLLDAHQDLIEDYKKGKNVFNFFVGSVMKETRGQANPAMTAKIVKEEIEKR